MPPVAPWQAAQKSRSGSAPSRSAISARTASIVSGDGRTAYVDGSCAISPSSASSASPLAGAQGRGRRGSAGPRAAARGRRRSAASDGRPTAGRRSRARAAARPRGSASSQYSPCSAANDASPRLARLVEGARAPPAREPRRRRTRARAARGSTSTRLEQLADDAEREVALELAAARGQHERALLGAPGAAPPGAAGSCRCRPGPRSARAGRRRRGRRARARRAAAAPAPARRAPVPWAGQTRARSTTSAPWYGRPVLHARAASATPGRPSPPRCRGSARRPGRTGRRRSRAPGARRPASE